MTKYKAGDKVTIVLDKTLADLYSNDEEFGKTIISHEPAPESIVKKFVVYKNGYVMHKTIEDQYYTGADEMGQFVVTTTGNDFTVERVTE